MWLQSSREIYHHPPIAYLCKIVMNQKAAFNLVYVSLFSLMRTATKNMPQVRNTRVSCQCLGMNRSDFSGAACLALTLKNRFVLQLKKVHTKIYFFAIISSLACHSKPVWGYFYLWNKKKDKFWRMWLSVFSMQ